MAATATTTATVYSVRDEYGYVLASGEYAPYVDDAAYNEACIVNDNGDVTVLTYYVNGEACFSRRKACFKNNIRAGYPHRYNHSERCVIDYCYYNPTLPHTIYDSEGDAWDAIIELMLASYNAMHDDDETFEQYMECELSYWSIIPLHQWREDARIKRFGARSVIR